MAQAKIPNGNRKKNRNYIASQISSFLLWRVCRELTMWYGIKAGLLGGDGIGKNGAMPDPT
jgi:hypothetical protein